MSIDGEINQMIEAGRLFRLEPSIPGDPEVRTVLMSVEINALMNGPWEHDTMRSRCGRLRADLESFMKGEVITVRWDPSEKKDAKVGRLDRVEDEVWDLRSQDPKPGLRVFFRFADTDMLVALTCSPRGVEVPWLRRAPLKEFDSREWRDAVLECRADWAKLFPANDPKRGDCIRDYISTNAILV